MITLLRRRPRVPYTDALTEHPAWPEAQRRVRRMGDHQLNESYIAMAADGIRAREQWEHHEHPQDALGEMLLLHIGMEAIRVETALRVARKEAPR
jgi:hypothetical protein